MRLGIFTIKSKLTSLLIIVILYGLMLGIIAVSSLNKIKKYRINTIGNMYDV